MGCTSFSKLQWFVVCDADKRRNRLFPAMCYTWQRTTVEYFQVISAKMIQSSCVKTSPVKLIVGDCCLLACCLSVISLQSQVISICDSRFLLGVFTYRQPWPKRSRCPPQHLVERWTWWFWKSLTVVKVQAAARWRTAARGLRPAGIWIKAKWWNAWLLLIIKWNDYLQSL